MKLSPTGLVGGTVIFAQLKRQVEANAALQDEMVSPGTVHVSLEIPRRIADVQAQILVVERSWGVLEGPEESIETERCTVIRGVKGCLGTGSRYTSDREKSRSDRTKRSLDNFAHLRLELIGLNAHKPLGEERHMLEGYSFVPENIATAVAGSLLRSVGGCRSLALLGTTAADKRVDLCQFAEKCKHPDIRSPIAVPVLLLQNMLQIVALAQLGDVRNGLRRFHPALAQGTAAGSAAGTADIAGHTAGLVKAAVDKEDRRGSKTCLRCRFLEPRCAS